MTKPSFRDWLASRTVRVHALFMAVYPFVYAIPTHEWLAMGISETWAHRLPVLIGIAHSIVGGYMRKVTDKPLSGRAE